MNDILLLYLFTRVDVIQGLLIAIAILGGAILLISGLHFGFELKLVKWWSFVKWKVLPIYVSVLLVSVLVPSQKDLAIIVGGHYAIAAAKSETAEKIKNIIDLTLDKQLKELKK